MGLLRKKSKSKPFLLLAFFALLWWGLPASWKLIVKTGFSEFHAPLWDLNSRLEDLSNYWGHKSDSKETLIEKGKRIKRISSNHFIQLENLENLENDERRLISLQQNLLLLEQKLSLQKTLSFSPLVARVSRRTFPSWWQSIGLRKGIDDGVKGKIGVISDDGVVGRVSKVGTRMTEVELITNTSFRIVAHFKGDDRPVTFQGSGIRPGGIPTGIVFDVPQDIIASSETPLNLVTSSLGQTFPRGIKIGTVFELDRDEDGLFKTGKVQLSNRLCKLQEVTLLLPTN